MMKNSFPAAEPMHTVKGAGYRRSRMINDKHAGNEPEAKIDEHRDIFENNRNGVFTHVFPHDEKKIAEYSEEDKNCSEDEIFRAENLHGAVSHRVQCV